MIYRKEIKEHPAVHLIKEFCRTYSERDLEGLLALFCKNHPVHLYGTGIDEDRRSLQEIKEQVLRDWEQSENAQLFPPKDLVYCEDPVSWAAGNFSAKVIASGQTLEIPNLRGSISIIREENEWKISQMHASFPAIDQEVGASFPSKVIG